VRRGNNIFYLPVNVGSKALEFEIIVELRRIASGIVRAGMAHVTTVCASITAC